MFRTLSRSWEFAKLSYRTLLDHKHLIVFPIVSTLATVLVVASFALPLWQTGQIEAWMSEAEQGGARGDPWIYVTLFLFYFCNYFVIVFFNTALVASTMNIMEDGKGTIGFGLSFAVRRIHSIFGWALVSAVVGVILRALERNERIGRLITSLIGSAWTALTYFVIPVIVSDGVGPVEAFKRSVRTLKSTWGTALAGNFSMGGIGFLLLLPVILVGVALFATTHPAVALAVTIPLFFLVFAATGAADAIFKAYLYSYATGRALPAGADPESMREAFRTTK
jgi:hypothetical protein